MDYVERWLLARYPESEVFGGGLQVQTTLDPAIENDALAAVNAALVGTTAPSTWPWRGTATTGFVEASSGDGTSPNLSTRSTWPSAVVITEGTAPLTSRYGPAPTGLDVLDPADRHRRRQRPPAGVVVEAVRVGHRPEAGNFARRRVLPGARESCPSRAASPIRSRTA